MPFGPAMLVTQDSKGTMRGGSPPPMRVAIYARVVLGKGSRHKKLATSQRPEWLERKPRALNLNVLRGRNTNGGYHNLIVAQLRICPNCDALKPKLT
jgi:hypothetical protein